VSRSRLSRGRRPLVVHVVGARPNYMKVAPVHAALERRGRVEQRLVHTGQHYDAAVKDVFFSELPLPQPNVQLEVGSGSHGEQTAKALAGLERVFAELRPALVLVPGDVNSTLAGALAAVKLHIPVCHLESGLRSFDWTMPEEHNRRVADHLSSLLLTHSHEAEENLAREGIAGEHVVLVGNTMIDALVANVRRARRLAVWRRLGLRAGGYVLVTLHRPALVDEPELLARTMTALRAVARELPVVFPVHPRTLARLRDLGGAKDDRVLLLEPQSYRRFLSLEAGAAAVVTDSGGVQEETTALGVPCFTLRDNTERPVTVSHGTNTVLGMAPERLLDIPALLAMRPEGRRVPPLWDGRAGERAAEAVERALGVGAAVERPRPAAPGRIGGLGSPAALPAAPSP
jgi:UDP-N-acetylglucosamine 2-epimerase (non-hydrolysing)